MSDKFLKKNRAQPNFLCQDRAAVRFQTKLKIGLVCVLSITSGVQVSNMVAQQAVAENTTFQVNVVESLSVSVTTDSSESSDVANTFLRVPVTVDVSSNNASGFTASMYATNDNADQTIGSHTVLNTDLTNGTTDYISTLSSNVQKSNFTANNWGYSLQNNTTDSTESTSGDNPAGKSTSTYRPVVSTSATPTTVMQRSVASTGTQTIWFGTKADITKTSGTYTNTVVLSVVTGDITEPDNPITPDDPVGPNDDTPNDNQATYTTSGVGASGVSGTTVYTTTSSSGASSTTDTQVSAGNITSSYSNPAGVTDRTSSTNGSPLAAGLAVAAGVAATSGAIFFILAKRKKDDEEDEEDQI